ncbi:MAG TPA: class I SAM-dependent methyltransferase [Pseudolabrys sp.]|nr:class I SAM-dependent methyltransferase [Pseudolabrys sp.]
MFDSTAPDYNLVEKILGFGTGPWYRRQALLRAGLKAGMRVVDVGVGTGLVATQAAAIVGSAGSVVGIDPSQGMLQNARVPTGVRLLEGRAEDIPLPDNSCDFLSMGYALRHVGDLSRAFAEFRRVLQPGGRLCILEITRPDSALQTALLKIYLRAVVPALARLIVRNRSTSLLWQYYWDSIEACAPPHEILRALQEAGFAGGDRVVSFGMFSEYRAEKPAL